SAIDQVLFLAQVILRGQVVDDGDRAKWCVFIYQSPGFHGKGSLRLGIDPLLSGKILFRLEGLAQKRREAAARRLDGLIQSIGGRDAENLLRGRIAPTHDPSFISRNDTRQDR